MPTKALLVDDEIPFLETLGKRLAKRDVQVFTATSGLQAIEKLRQAPDIDVVVLDVKMPGIDGIETLKAVKQNHPLVEVIMLTGHATVESAIEGMKLGALDYLMKPCDMDILMTKIQEGKSKKSTQEAKIAEARALHTALRRGE